MKLDREFNDAFGCQWEPQGSLITKTISAPICWCFQGVYRVQATFRRVFDLLALKRMSTICASMRAVFERVCFTLAFCRAPLQLLPPEAKAMRTVCTTPENRRHQTDATFLTLRYCIRDVFAASDPIQTKTN